VAVTVDPGDCPPANPVAALSAKANQPVLIVHEALAPSELPLASSTVPATVTV
jgi:hypothetical protein